MDNSEMLQDELLKTLSFLEPMSLEFIFLDLDKDFLMNNPELTYEDLQTSLNKLTKTKKVKQIKDAGQLMWIKVYPKRKAWWQKLLGL